MTAKDLLDALNSMQGNGFSGSDFTEEERSAVRQFLHHYAHNAKSTSEIIDEAGLRWVSAIAKGFPAFMLFFTPVSVVGGTLLMLQKFGWFQ